MSTQTLSNDLTQHAPRSPHAKLGGYVSLPRIIDKARAAAAGTLGAYKYEGSGLNRHFFSFVGIDPEAFKAEVARGGGDWAVLEWVQANATFKRAAWEIRAWSEYQVNRIVDSDYETLEKFAQFMKATHPDREDIKTRYEFLDLDDYVSFGGKA
jgi:hypothetical protein